MKNLWLKNTLFFICALLFYLIVWRYMTKVALESLGLITPDRTVSYYILMLFLITGAYMVLHLSGRRERLVSSYMIAYLGVITTTMINAMSEPLRSGVLPFQIVLPALIMFYAFKFFQTTEVTKYHEIIFLLMYVLLAVHVFQDIQTIILMSLTEEFVTSTTFIILFLLPLVLCFDNKVIKIVGIVTVLIALLLSGKRSGMISFTLGVITYFFFSLTRFTTKKKLLMIVLFIAAMIPLAMFFSSISDNFYIFERLEGFSEDKGSGRDDVYKNVTKLIDSSDLGQMVIGHGWDAVTQKSGMPAHNDIMELIYDCGWPVAILYVFFIIYLIKYTYKLYKTKNKYTGSMAASLVIFLVHTNISHVLLYPEYMMPFALFWGCVLGINSRSILKYKAHENRNINIPCRL